MIEEDAQTAAQQIAALREACDLLLPFAEEWAENWAEREVISRARALLAQPATSDPRGQEAG